eukprot:CAMPEP_0177759908 /NCGR_PEP_ID=MMETSP0491_2-20121128/4983_1 /TAXON_ID=63592 /ORGANISM="Tetraselmis chuii, Strain PLY429" /LENGTH=306 /DNA_ID=CAMNT_0019275769 /DNA_START=40 /DNA_END=957 /DNA_ORIENTATION=+
MLPPGTTTTAVSRHASRGAGKAGLWTSEEDELLRKLVVHYGAQNWAAIAVYFPTRSNKSCRLRWFNELRPGIKKDDFSDWEDAVIAKAAIEHGTKWATIARFLPGRTDNAVKNRWHVVSKQAKKDNSATSCYNNLSLDELLAAGSSTDNSSGVEAFVPEGVDRIEAPLKKQRLLEPVTPPRAPYRNIGDIYSPSQSVSSAAEARYIPSAYDNEYWMQTAQKFLTPHPSSESATATGSIPTTYTCPMPHLGTAPVSLTPEEPEVFLKMEQAFRDADRSAVPSGRYYPHQNGNVTPSSVPFSVLKAGW